MTKPSGSGSPEATPSVNGSTASAGVAAVARVSGKDRVPATAADPVTSPADRMDLRDVCMAESQPRSPDGQVAAK